MMSWTRPRVMILLVPPHPLLLSAPAKPDQTALRAVATTERFTLTDHALYLHAPGGIGRSPLVDRLERAGLSRTWGVVVVFMPSL